MKMLWMTEGRVHVGRSPIIHKHPPGSLTYTHHGCPHLVGASRLVDPSYKEHTMSTKSITSAFAALLNTVGTVAETVTKTVDTAASGLDLTAAYVIKAKQKQEANNAVEMANFYSNLIKESALEQATIDLALEKELKSNPDLKAHYDNNQTKLASIVDALEAKYTPVH